MAKLAAQNWSDLNKRGIDKNLIAQNTSQLLPVSTDLAVVLGRTVVKIRELLDVQIGDVIRLDAVESDEVAVQVGVSKKFLAYPGKIGNQRAIKITHVLT